MAIYCDKNPEATRMIVTVALKQAIPCTQKIHQILCKFKGGKHDTTSKGSKTGFVLLFWTQNPYQTVIKSVLSAVVLLQSNILDKTMKLIPETCQQRVQYSLSRDQFLFYASWVKVLKKDKLQSLNHLFWSIWDLLISFLDFIYTVCPHYLGIQAHSELADNKPLNLWKGLSNFYLPTGEFKGDPQEARIVQQEVPKEP